MPKLVVYNSMSLDGYFTDANGDMNWAHKHDPEWQAFVSENASRGGQLLFGRVTYDLMAGFWPTALAAQSNPVVVERMNNLRKFVFSRKLDRVTWNNTTLLKGDLAVEVRKLKQEPGPNIVVMGSGSVVAQLAEAGLTDEYQIVLNPIVVGGGRTMFEGVIAEATRRRKPAPARSATLMDCCSTSFGGVKTTCPTSISCR